MFIGPHARTFDPRQPVLVNPNDGQPRQEISDHQSRLLLSAAEITNAACMHRPVPLAAVLEHPALYRAYPELRYHRIHFTMFVNSLEATSIVDPRSYTTGMEVNVSILERNERSDRSTAECLHAIKAAVLHETQHIIQMREGFPNGTSPEIQALQAHTRRLAALDRWAMRHAGQPDTLARIAARKAAMTSLNRDRAKDAVAEKKLGEKRYVLWPGEAEAISTQWRVKLTEAERAQKLPHFMKSTGMAPKTRAALPQYTPRSLADRLTMAYNKTAWTLRHLMGRLGVPASPAFTARTDRAELARTVNRGIQRFNDMAERLQAPDWLRLPALSTYRTFDRAFEVYAQREKQARLQAVRPPAPSR